MTRDRTYSTRELAEMWNVSETTIKRWADSGVLKCFRTPGGHRKFKLDHISEFQASRGFEATGILTRQDWEDPDVENFLNQKNPDKLRQTTLYLASQNQVNRVRELLERLYIRGVQLAEIYDELLLPAIRSAGTQTRDGSLSVGQKHLICTNLEAAVAYFFPRIVRRRSNGKTALCASPDERCCMLTSAVARVLESEGWECLNLGDRTPPEAMAAMVREEPITLVCLCCASPVSGELSDQLEVLADAAEEYRIPLVTIGEPCSANGIPGSRSEHHHFQNMSSLRHYLNATSR